MIRQALLTFFLALMVGGFLLIWDSPPESFVRQSGDQFEKDPARRQLYERDYQPPFFSTGQREVFS